MTERHGIEIDCCPQCRGVWLDRGELDKMIEQAAQEAADAPPAPADRPVYPPDDPHYRHRRKRWLTDLFDFD